MGKKKKGGGGGGGGFKQTGDGQCPSTFPFSPVPDQALCNTDHANTDLNTTGGDEVVDSKGGKGGGKEGGTLVTAVLKVDFHCDGCTDRIRRSFKGFKGVEGVKIDRGANKVTVVGTMDPWKLRDRIQKKTKKKAEVLSPAQKQGGGEKQNKKGDKSEKNCDNPKVSEKGDKEDDKKGDEEDEKKGEKQDEKPCNPKEEGNKKGEKQVVVVNTIVLKVVLHCDGCIRRIRGVLVKMKGVEQVTIDRHKNQITVKGTMDTKGFAELLSKKIERHVEVVVPQKEKEKEKEKGEKNGKENSCTGLLTCHADMGWCPCDKCGYHVYMVPAPQLFSDENTNACALM